MEEMEMEVVEEMVEEMEMEEVMEIEGVAFPPPALLKGCSNDV